MARVLYLSYDGMTDPLGMSQVIPYLRELKQKGHEIVIVSFEKEANFKRLQIRISTELINCGIYWEPLSYTKSPPVLSTIYDLFKLKKKVERLRLQFQPEIIHCRSYLTALVGSHYKRIHKTPFLFDMRGFWADERVEGGIWNLSNPLYNWIYRFFKRREKELLESADHSVSLTERAKKILHSWDNVKGQPIPITVIPCCVDTNHFDPDKISTEERNKLKEELGINREDFVLSYLGSIGTWYLLDEMLQFFYCLLEMKPEAKFLFISAEDPQGILKVGIDYGIPERNIIVRRVERDEVPAYLNLSDLSIFFIKPSFSKSASSPTKQGEIMSMNIPFVCNSGVGDTDFIVKNSGAGWLVETMDVEHYNEVLKNIFVRPWKLKFGREFAKMNLSIQVGVEKYQRIYQLLIFEQH